MITIIVSADKNWLIGSKGDLPWRISADLRLFRKLTTGHPIVMGTRTWESLPKKPLPGRLNIVISRHEVSDKCLKASSLDAVLSLKPYFPEIFIIGGAKVFSLALTAGVVDRILLSRVKGEYSGDVYFPHHLIEGWKVKFLESYGEFNLFEYKR